LENELREADLRQTAASRQLEIMENTLTDRQETLVACEAKIEELAIKNAELVEQLEREAEADAVASVSFISIFAFNQIFVDSKWTLAVKTVKTDT